MKKQKWALIAGIALALIAALCLWYTRPQKLAAILDGWKPDSLSASVTDSTPVIKGDQVTSNIDTWLLNGTEEETPAVEEIWSVLEGREYRAPISSIPHNLFAPDKGYVVHGSQGTVSLIFSREGAAWVSVTAYGDSSGTVFISSPDSIGSYRYQAGEGLYDALASIVRQYGAPQKG